ncbi:MAG: hypothetical protein ABFC90_07130 [Bacteroidales bacterium]|nr:hypothetical protein [Bacteroidales bacterium]MEA4840595.1 hypothetical protein [Bacteroidales bacterium]
MSNKINNKINEALYNFYLKADKDIIDDSLRDAIQNLEEYNKKKKQIIFLAQAKAQQKQNEYLKELLNKFKEGINENIDRPVAILKQIIQNNPSFAMYCNIEKLSNEDIIEILKDKNLVELLEQLEENDQSH